MGQYSTNGMSGDLSTPRTRALEEWEEKGQAKEAELMRFIHSHKREDESFEKVCERLIGEGLLKRKPPRYPRGTEPQMTIDEMKALAADALTKRG